MSRTFLIAVGVGVFIALPSAADEIATLPSSEDPNIRIGVFRATVPISWGNAKDEIEGLGGTLFAPQTESDRDDVRQLVTTLGPWDCIGPWVGAQRIASSEPLTSAWEDVGGQPLNNVPWSGDQPYGLNHLFWNAAIDARTETYDTWLNVLPDPDAGADVYGYVFFLNEPFPDCDEDGIPDQMEIELLGETDADGDGIPDVCFIPGDITGDGRVDGMDLAVLLGSWGPCAPSLPCPGDLDGNGMIDGVDLGLVLGSWTG